MDEKNKIKPNEQKNQAYKSANSSFNKNKLNKDNKISQINKPKSADNKQSIEKTSQINKIDNIKTDEKSIKSDSSSKNNSSTQKIEPVKKSNLNEKKDAVGKNTVSENKNNSLKTNDDKKQTIDDKNKSTLNKDKTQKDKDIIQESTKKPQVDNKTIKKDDDKIQKEKKLPQKTQKASKIPESEKAGIVSPLAQKPKHTADAVKKDEAGFTKTAETAIDEINPNDFFFQPGYKIEKKPPKYNPAQKYAIAREQAKKDKKRRIIITVCVIAAVILAVAGAALFSFLNTGFDDDEDLKAKEELTAVSFDEPFYMLLVGTDTREAGNSYSLDDGRSDSCILVRIDPVNYIVTMISIPRDTKMTINGSTQKFNAAYAAGGISSTIKAVKKLTGVDISHYAEISFNGLTDMVDAVGGVDVYVPNEINDPNTKTYVPSGQQTLNGEQALSFARSRKFGDGDFTRTADQRVLMDALIKKAYQMPISDLPNLLKAAKNFIKTDLTLGDMLGLAKQFMEADKELTVYSAMVPSYTSSEGGVSYVITDKDALRRMIALMENGEDPLLVEITSGASVCSSRDLPALKERQKKYYEEHPDSVGKATSKKSPPKNTQYDDYNSNGSSYNSNGNSSNNSYNNSNSSNY